MNTPLDPYRPPQDSTAASAPPKAGGRPGALTAICVIAIVLGAMGLMGAVVGCGSLVLGSQMQQVDHGSRRELVPQVLSHPCGQPAVSRRGSDAAATSVARFLLTWRLTCRC